MEAERWKKIESIFHAALQVDEGRRAAILEESCAGDESLRREVESLLAHHKKGETFIEKPAFATASQTISARTEPSSGTAVGTPSLVGATIGQYRVVGEIGAGGMGVVYKAEDIKLGRLVALKFLPENRASDALALERFQREARAASALNHPNICTIYDIEEYQGCHFIAMEYLDGEALKDHIQGRTLASDEISTIGSQIAEALAAAHTRGVVHRDIKPGNIIVTGSGLVKVLDFGLAKLVRTETAAPPVESLTCLTEPQAVTGTLPYMSPEQLRGRGVDARTDIYALGVVLYEMSSGRRPFVAQLLPELIDQILNSPPPPLREANPNLSVPLEQIILNCLEKKPEDRYQSAKEVAADLRRIASPSAISERLIVGKPKRVPRTARLLWAAAPILAFILLMLAWSVHRSSYFNSIRSIAVLPLVDDSKDTSSPYIGDGISEGVIYKLSEIPELRVMSRNSAFRFKGKEVDAQAAGRDLKVQTILTGRIVRQADALTISAELVNVSDGTQMWGRQFHYAISDLARVQDDLATAVLEKLGLHPNQAEGTRLAKPVTQSPEAYQLYLQARFFWNQRTPPGIRKSIEFFQQATNKDPNFALAYAGLADAYNISNSLGILKAKDSLPQARTAATKALALDPQLGEAHAALGIVKSHYDHDFSGAQTEFLKAIQLSPNYAYAHTFYAGAYLNPMGRHGEAIAEMKKALELDPLSPALNSLMGNSYLYAGEHEKAVQQYQHAIDLDPRFPLAHIFLAFCLDDMGRFEEAIAETQKADLLFGASPQEAQAQAEEFRKAFRTGGANGYWQKNLEMGLQQATQYDPQPLPLAIAYAAVGNKDKAFEWLEKAYEERDGNITLLNCYPHLRTLRGDPRFSDLLRRMGLPQ